MHIGMSYLGWVLNLVISIMEFVWISALCLLMFAYTFVLLGSIYVMNLFHIFSLKDILSMLLRLGLGCQNASHFLAFVFMCLLTLQVSFYYLHYGWFG